MAKLSKEKALEKINEGEGDFHVSTQDEHDTFLNNLKDTEIFKEQIDSRVSEIHHQYDNDWHALTGKRKGQNEKTYDFIKKEGKILIDKSKELEDKNKSLQKAVDEKSGNDEALNLLKRENEELLEKHQNKMDEWKSKFETREKEVSRIQDLADINESISSIKFKDTSIIPEDLRNMSVNALKSELLGIADREDGKLVFRNSKGEIMRDESTLIPLTAEDLVKNKLKPFIDEGRKQTGVDIKDPEFKLDDKGKIEDVILSLPDDVTTKGKLDDHLIGLGYARGSTKYLAAYKKYSKDLK